MSEKPLIVRVITAPDWLSAFRLAWTTTFGAIAADATPPMEYLRWSGRRGLCLSYAKQCIEDAGNEDLAGAWSALGAEPACLGHRSAEGDQAYATLFGAIARAIVADPALLDDAYIVEAIEGWRFLERAGSDGADDLIAYARRQGGMLKVDRNKLLTWARMRAGAAQ